MRLRYIFVIAFTAAALAALVLYAGQRINSEPLVTDAPAQPASIAKLRGFAPGADVEFKVISPGQETVTGQAQTGDDGTLEIPAPSICQDTDTALTYDFSIREQEDSEPVNLTFKMQTGTGEMSVSGEGLEKFGPVSVNGKNTQVEGRADWAGIYRHKGMWQLNPEEINSFELAYFGDGFENMSPDPRIIQIFTAPGGGTFSGTGPLAGQGINAYRNLWCETTNNGRVVPSTCRAQTMGPYRWNGTCPTDHMAVQAANIMNGWIRAMKMATNQLYAVLVHQVFIIGTFIDAKQQLETQREIQKLTAEAHKDYMPSDTMCRFGSFTKSLADTEQRVQFNKLAMNNMMMANYTNRMNSTSAGGFDDDMRSRIQQYRRVYCDTRDNNNGLRFMCDHNANFTDGTRGLPVPNGIGAVDTIRPGPLPQPVPPSTTPPPPPPPITSYRMNKDIDFARTMNYPYTLDLDFTNGTLTNDEEDVLALGRNLYWPRVLENPKSQLLPDASQLYQDVRSIAAMQNVAHNSFIEIASMKSNAAQLPDPNSTATPQPDVSGWNFMKSMMREFGMSDMNIHEFLGEYPSYYAQMEVLTKKMYENPDFYTNLYDTPANLKRISVSMDTLRLMQQRDQYESRIRQELLTSLILEHALRQKYHVLNDAMTSEVKSFEQ